MNQIISVYQLVKYLKDRLEFDPNLTNISVRGEISNFKVQNNSGHFYFSLKDENSNIACIMFNSFANRINFKPKDGLQVIVKANLKVYEPQGKMQLYVIDMIDDGLGDLNRKFEELKKKLNDEGYFDNNHKKMLPKYPTNIAIVTGQNTAALSDVLTTISRRWPITNLVVYPTQVQGDKAHLDIIEALNKADQNNHDVILLIRGGGSIEDLWCFNNEELVKFIYYLKTPIVTGIGHEIDFTLCDFVADVRANTPTAASELTTPDINDVKNKIYNYNKSLIKGYLEIQTQYRSSLDNIVNYKIINVKNRYFQDKELKLINYQNIINKFPNNIKELKNRNDILINRIINISETFIQTNKHYLDNKINELNNSFNEYSRNIKNNYRINITLLDAYSPLKTLNRGYSITKDLNGKVINDINKVSLNDKIEIIINNGELEAQVLKKIKKV